VSIPAIAPSRDEFAGLDLATATGPSGRQLRARFARRILAGAATAAVLSSIALVAVTGIWHKPLDVPFQYTRTATDDQQDATLEMMVTKNVAETGWYLHNPQLNAPFGQQWAEWPMGGDVVAYGFKKAILAATGNNVALTVNLFWLLTFPLTAAVAYPVMRALRVSHTSSLVAAVLFALSPYHFRNSIGHENLAFYVSAPLTVLLCVRLMDARPRPRAPASTDGKSAMTRLAALRAYRPGVPRFDSWCWPIAAAFLIGVTGLYYLAFFLALGLCSALFTSVMFRTWRSVRDFAVMGAAALGASALGNLPTLLFRARNAPNPLAVGSRAASASESLPLRLTELLSPIYHHRFPPFAALSNLLAPSGPKGFETANLGLAGSIGCIVLVVGLLWRAARPDHHTATTRPRRAPAAIEVRLGIIVVFALLLATQGGLDRVLAPLGFSDIRAWVRIVVDIAFASLVAFARLLDRVRYRLRRRLPRPRTTWAAILAIVCIAGVLDQTSSAFLPQPQQHSAAWHADAAFVGALQRRLPHHAMVFQLPVSEFPEGGGHVRMADYDLIKEGYLHSSTLRWSAGNVRGRNGDWQFTAALLPVRQFVTALSAVGFSALTLDRYGYQDSGHHLIGGLRSVLGAPMLRGDGNRLFAWDLRPYARRLRATLAPAAITALRDRTLFQPRIYLVSPVRRRITARVTTVPRSVARVLFDVAPPFRWRGRLGVTVHTEPGSRSTAIQLLVGHQTVLVPADGQRHWVTVATGPGTTVMQVFASSHALDGRDAIDLSYRVGA
jgi:hypothetical protein